MKAIITVTSTCKVFQVHPSQRTYPTVVMVTIAHHMPSKMPLQNRLGNISEFDRWSLMKIKE